MTSKRTVKLWKRTFVDVNCDCVGKAVTHVIFQVRMSTPTSVTYLFQCMNCDNDIVYECVYDTDFFNYLVNDILTHPWNKTFTQ